MQYSLHIYAHLQSDVSNVKNGCSMVAPTSIDYCHHILSKWVRPKHFNRGRLSSYGDRSRAVFPSRDDTTEIAP